MPGLGGLYMFGDVCWQLYNLIRHQNPAWHATKQGTITARCRPSGVHKTGLSALLATFLTLLLATSGGACQVEHIET